jgi:hypothetical protein
MSKKYFCPGGLARLEWTRSVRAVRDSLMVQYTASGLNTTRQAAYRPPIAVALSPLALSVTYVKRKLWHWGRLWPYIGMCSFGTRRHRECNAMGDIAKISPCVPSTCAQNDILSLLIIHIIPSRQIYLAIDNPSLVQSVSCFTHCSYLLNYLRAADDVSHTESLQSNGCQCVSHSFKFQDGIQVSSVFRYYGEHQG